MTEPSSLAGRPLQAPLRVACLGAGYFSRFHLDAWRRIDAVELVGSADLERDKASATGLPAFENIGELLAETRPDVLDIITPPFTHLDAIRDAIEGGVKAIICQKPFCRTPEDARHAIQLASHAGVRLVVHENFRFQPWYRTIAETLREGGIGDVQQATFRLRTGDGQGPDAYLSRQPYFRSMPRLLVHETAVHWIDTFRFLLGEIQAVYADLRRLNPVITGEDAGYILFDFAGGGRALFDGNRHLDHCATDTRTTFGEALVEGTEGSLSLLGNGAVYKRRFGESETSCLLEARDWKGFGGDCVHALQLHVINGLLNGTPLENEASEYLKVIEVENAIYLSAEQQRKVRV